MNDVAKYAEEIIVMQKGEVQAIENPRTLLVNLTYLTNGISPYRCCLFTKDFETKYQTKLPSTALTEEEFAELYRSGKMKNKLIIGRYLPSNSFIHHLDPRSKLIFVFVLLFLSFYAIPLVRMHGCLY